MTAKSKTNSRRGRASATLMNWTGYDVVVHALFLACRGARQDSFRCWFTWIASTRLKLPEKRRKIKWIWEWPKVLVISLHRFLQMTATTLSVYWRVVDPSTCQARFGASKGLQSTLGRNTTSKSVDSFMQIQMNIKPTSKPNSKSGKQRQAKNKYLNFKRKSHRCLRQAAIFPLILHTFPSFSSSVLEQIGHTMLSLI